MQPWLLAAQQADGGVSVGDDGGGAHGAGAVPQARPGVQVRVVLGRGGGHGDGRRCVC